MRKIYLVEIEKIDFGFLDKDSQTIQLEFMKSHPIIDTTIIMDINTIQKLQRTIDEMFELKKKKEELRNKRLSKKETMTVNERK